MQSPPGHRCTQQTLKGSGRIVTETRDVGSFHAVEAGSTPTSVVCGDYPCRPRDRQTDDNLSSTQTSVAEGMPASDWQTSRCKTPN